MMSATMDQRLNFNNREEQGAPQAAVLVMEANPQQAARGGCDMSAHMDQGQGREKIAQQVMDELEQEAQRWVREAARTDTLLRVSRIKQRSAWTHSAEARKFSRRLSSDRSG